MKKAVTKRPAKKAVKRSAVKKRAVPAYSPLYYDLHSLLHTVRHIAAAEDELCSLLEEAKASGEMDKATVRDLRRVLERLPVREFVSEVESVRGMLGRSR
ncbi:MAG: hypothetical protein JSS87_08810 [Acidobacteria bacterium]|nr:hypothetical protein [Acidobacteriota bacterium]